MQDWDDNQLLDEYARQGSEEAFALLVRRHIDKVHSTALRCSRNPVMAEEITEAVFVLLAIKAWQFNKQIILSAWLYKTARLTALTHIRSEIRRVHREQEACMQKSLEQAGSETWQNVAPLLDSAMAELNEADRAALVLRFFDSKSLRDVGLILGASEDAAKKRVNRALEKLRRIFSRQGVNSTTALLAECLTGHAVPAAPPKLAGTIAVTALAKSASYGQVSPLLKGTLKFMAWSKTKTAAVTALVILLTTGAATFVVKKNHSRVVLGAPKNIAFGKIFLGPANPGIELYSEKTAPPAAPMQAPFSGDGEIDLPGWHYWFHGAKGSAFVFVDGTDAATGKNDLTLGNTEEGDANRADWRSQKFDLGPAANGREPVSFSFACKIPGDVKNKENLSVHLRFLDATGTNVLHDYAVDIGSATSSANMIHYKTLSFDGLVAPKNARKADIRITANHPPNVWTSGVARFDDFSVTAHTSMWAGLFH
jgi:RNA polymerase sigma factor (sigma-70 family)